MTWIKKRGKMTWIKREERFHGHTERKDDMDKRRGKMTWINGEER